MGAKGGRMGVPGTTPGGFGGGAAYAPTRPMGALPPPPPGMMGPATGPAMGLRDPNAPPVNLPQTPIASMPPAMGQPMQPVPLMPPVGPGAIAPPVVKPGLPAVGPGVITPPMGVLRPGPGAPGVIRPGPSPIVQGIAQAIARRGGYGRGG